MATSRSVATSFVLAVLLVTCFSTKSISRTWYINPIGTGDAPTIQAGIILAQAGDTVLLSGGEYTGPGNRDLNFLGKAITVRSYAWDPDGCRIDCQGLGRGFYFGWGEDYNSVLEGVTIMNGWQAGTPPVTYAYGAGIYCTLSSSPTISNCKFSFNSGYFIFGAGMYCDSTSSPTLTNCTFDNNFADLGNGGGMACLNSDPTLTNCVFSANSALDGGGMICVGGSPSLTNCTFSGNTANKGGGIYDNYSSAVLTGCTFSGNSASANAGGMSCNSSYPVLTNCVFVGNAALAGGGMVCNDSDAELINCTFFGNSGTILGGAMWNTDSSVWLENTLITFSRAGEAIVGSPNLICCDIYGNAGGDWTGEIANQFGVFGNISINPFFCDTASGDFTLLAKYSACLPANNPCGVLIGVYGEGCDVPVGIVSGNVTKPQLRLRQNYPNPFNPQTTIAYALPDAGHVRLLIYDVQGRFITDLVDRYREAGEYQVMWNGRDNNGVKVGSGVYFVRLEFEGQAQTHKIVMLK